MMRATLWIGVVGLMSIGCATPRAVAGKSDGVTPVIAISPGVAGRLALMDRYRLHDEERKHMMERPHVWVEEAADDPGDEEGAAAEPTAEESAKPSQ